MNTYVRILIFFLYFLCVVQLTENQPLKEQIIFHNRNTDE